MISVLRELATLKYIYTTCTEGGFTLEKDLSNVLVLERVLL